jgi:sec-independent protein translocase protein TatC
MLTKYRKYIFLIIVIISALLTPPDVISQILLAAPMIVLFEISVIFAKLISKRRTPPLETP